MDRLGFLTTFGRELCEAIEQFEPDATSQDCYDAFTNVVSEDLSLSTLKGLQESDFKDIAVEFCNYFEISTITSDCIKSSIQGVIGHWDEGGE